ncbi:MAG: HAMP domain-containing protein [Lachnospiraceae bacterium]|nr:HAMP domain-containing protein [Lachnospiraceae bacterium]
MNRDSKRTSHLGRKVNGLVIFLLILSIITVVSLCIAMFYRLIMDMMEDRCINGTDILAYELERNDSEDKTLLLDELKERMDCEFTIFEGDVRAYTTVEQDGKRMTGTKLSKDLADIILNQGKRYIGQAEIIGVEHLCSYVPVTDADGTVTGLIFAGISVADVRKQINRTVFMACGAGGILLLLSAIVMSFFISRSVSRPLSRLTSLAQTMEEGNLGLGQEGAVTINIHSNDEIGLLAHIFENTILRLRNYIGEISAILESISDGNLTAGTTQDYIGDFTSIKSSLDDILGKLNHTMSQIAESTQHVSNGSKQMSIGAQALSQGAVEQSSAVEELEDTIETIAKQAEQTAKGAQDTSQKVENVSQQLMESNRKMQEMILAMKEISESSNEISNIIKTIENISQQTNILALNSSVEAARAGEAGKGFAVVAKEVRELAGKSAEASQSTNSLIERSIHAVEYGTKIANETGLLMESVVDGTNEAVTTINQIADAARLQAQAVSQIQDRIIQISDVVQTNSATAQESAATSQQLSSQAGLLQNLIEMFRLK